MSCVDGVETYLRPLSDLAGIRACFDVYGVVGVTGVLSAEESTAVLTEGLDPFLPEGCSIADPDSYHLSDHSLNRFGVVGKLALFNQRLFRTRLHPNVVAAYQAVYGRTDIFACHDRAAWMRPTALFDAWETPFKWPGVHLDVSARGFFEKGYREKVDNLLESLSYDDHTGFVAENNAKHESMGRSVQGVLNLIDNREEDGGFHCVSGLFGESLRTWVANHKGLPDPEPNGRYNFQSFGPDADLACWTERVPCPAGTLILWDATLPHGTKPNVSERSRAMLLLRYMVADQLPPQTWHNRNEALRRIARSVDFIPDAREELHLYGPRLSRDVEVLESQSVQC